MKTCGFKKREHLCSLYLIDKLFEAGQSKTYSAFPLRIVFNDISTDSNSHLDDVTKVLISVSKRHFHHAVDRNRVKRQIREAYRTQKHLLPEGKFLNIAFLWLDNKHYPTEIIKEKVAKLLQRCSEYYLQPKQ